MGYHNSFEWDPQKAKTNAQKHRVTFEDAAFVLADDQAERFHYEKYDAKHSMGEDRYITLASHPHRRSIVLLISWTSRRKQGGETVTRIISARRANSRERAEYAKAIRSK